MRGCRGQGAYMHAHNPDFAIAYDDVAFLDLDVARTDRLDFPALQNQTGLKALFDEVIVRCFAIIYNTHVSLGAPAGKIPQFYTVTVFNAYRTPLCPGPLHMRADVRSGGRC